VLLIFVLSPALTVVSRQRQCSPELFASGCTEIKHPGLLVQKSQQLSLPSASECQVLATSERKDSEEACAGIKVLPKKICLASRASTYQCNCKHFANYLTSCVEKESHLLRPSQALAESL